MADDKPAPKAGAKPKPVTRILKWGGLSLLGLVVVVVGGFYGYHWVKDLLYKPKTKTVRSKRPELGNIKLVPSKSSDGVPGWVAHFYLDVPPKDAWARLSKCTELAKALKGVTSCTDVEKKDNWVITKMILKHPDGAWMRNKTVYYPAEMRSEWKMLEGSFQAAAGAVKLEPVEGNPGWSKVIYSYFLKISPLLPKNFERPRVRRSVKHQANEIQAYFAKSPIPRQKKRKKRKRPRPMK